MKGAWWLRLGAAALLLGMTNGLAAQAHAARAAIVFDRFFVDTKREARFLLFSLEALGHEVRFLGSTDTQVWIEALAAVDVLVIPELERLDLAMLLEDEARVAIADFVAAGGALITIDSTSPRFSKNTTNFLNGIFGYGLVGGEVLGSSLLDAGAVVGTAFEGGPASLPDSNATEGVVTVSLPPGAISVYRQDGMTTVFVADHGAGRIGHLGFDWWEDPTPPAWEAVLGAALSHVLDLSLPFAVEQAQIKLNAAGLPTRKGTGTTLKLGLRMHAGKLLPDDAVAVFLDGIPLLMAPFSAFEPVGLDGPDGTPDVYRLQRSKSNVWAELDFAAGRMRLKGRNVSLAGLDGSDGVHVSLHLGTAVGGETIPLTARGTLQLEYRRP